MNSIDHVPAPYRFANVIPALHVKIVEPAASRVLACTKAHGSKMYGKSSNEEPRITLIKQGDIVHAIEIVCTCGELIRFECEY